MSESKPLLGRCKQCDFALFADRDQVVTVPSFGEVKDQQVPYWVQDASGFFARCPNRHKVFVLKPIKGTYSDVHKCDVRCMNAKGHDCTCSCGGMNHGRGHAVEIITAKVPTIVPVDKEPEPITDKQEKFIRSLLSERNIPDGKGQSGAQRREAAVAKLNRSEINRKQASNTIEWLLDLPKLDEE